MKAKEKLINTFFDILTIKRYDDITISELCLVSKVHRTTFYLYFDNIYELLEASIEEAQRRFSSYFPKKEKVKNHMSKDYLVPYFTFIKDYKNLFLAYLDNATLFKAERTFDWIYNNVALVNSIGADPKMVKYITLFYLGGIIQIVKEWIQGNFIETPEELSEIVLFFVIKQN